MRPFRSIVQVLIGRIFVLAMVVLLIALGLQAWWAKAQNEQHFQELMQEVSDTNVPMMALALWDIEPDALRAQIDFLAKRPEIGYVQLKATTGQVFEKGAPSLLDSEYVHRLRIGSPQGNLTLGELTLVVNPSYFWRNFFNMAWQAALAYCLLTTVICLLIVYMLKHDLQRPLQNIAHFASELTSENLIHTLQLDPRSNAREDEIDMLARAFAQLQHSLRLHIDDLNALVTERTAQQEKLQLANQKSQVANLAKSQFLATISHELKTPLNGILGMAQLLKLADITHTQRMEYAQIILDSGNSLDTLIKDLLDISQIEANKLVLRSEPCDVVALTQDVTTLFLRSAQQKNLTLESNWLGQPNGLFRTDPIRLRQMLSNLVSNAIKFTETGFVRIVVQEVERNDAEAILEFSVSDSGIGIAEDKLDLLFKRFSQVDASHTRSFEGTGLGLSIIEGLAKRMGGGVGVESQLGVGSRFWFRVQVVVLDASGNLWGDATKSFLRPSVLDDATPTMASPLTAVFTKPVQPSNRGMAMVVEDNPINQKIVQAALARVGMRAVCLSNGLEALNAVTQGLQPQVILMDMQMPVMNGLEATQAIRAWELGAQAKRIPILGLTAGSGPDIEQECIDSGMDAVLFKPVDLDLLQSEVLQYVGLAEKN